MIRTEPGQKKGKGKEVDQGMTKAGAGEAGQPSTSPATRSVPITAGVQEAAAEAAEDDRAESESESESEGEEVHVEDDNIADEAEEEEGAVEEMTKSVGDISLSASDSKPQGSAADNAISSSLTNAVDLSESTPSPANQEQEQDEDSESDGGEWITPANITQHRSHDLGLLPDEGKGAQASPLAAACFTGDYAVQNVLLGMGLGLIGEGGKRIKQVKSFVLRCHACFK
jgi:RNA-binding protein NOB1